jgi:hypothetical protein
MRQPVSMRQRSHRTGKHQDRAPHINESTIATNNDNLGSSGNLRFSVVQGKMRLIRQPRVIHVERALSAKGVKGVKGVRDQTQLRFMLHHAK